jgi:oxygen-independent coproporphyrinogen-3 oxidase
VSLGIQCDDNDTLKRLGRPHTYEDAVKAVKRIRKKGFRNLSVDLMFGLPGQRLQDWEKTLKNVLTLKPEHISCYGLKVEENTPLYANKDFYNLADDDLQADMYLSAVQILKDHGYRQYEISNFCRKGQVSRHNLKYWTGGEYLGFGPDASSDFGGRRFAMIRDLQAYTEGIRQGGMVLRENQEVTARERAGEFLMMRLRTANGVDPKEYEKSSALPFAPLEGYFERCRQNKLAEKTYDGRWRLTPEGFLVSNTIITDLLLLQDRSTPFNR